MGKASSWSPWVYHSSEDELKRACENNIKQCKKKRKRQLKRGNRKRKHSLSLKSKQWKMKLIRKLLNSKRLSNKLRLNKKKTRLERNLRSKKPTKRSLSYRGKPKKARSNQLLEELKRIRKRFSLLWNQTSIKCVNSTSMNLMLTAKDSKKYPWSNFCLMS